jgi:GT2 family glycosyltransferase
LLSIIIVNYNVKYFIEQCLYSVQKAIAGMEAEVIVVDNNSADESVAYLKEIFSWVIFISNKENRGYAKANNQGLLMAKSNYILFLNPDTIIGEDSLKKSIQVLQQGNHLGALGTRMIDGTGNFLPESKRGFPSPAASFFKLTGLVKIFPQSRMMGKYYMGWLPEQDNNETEVLSGAYMMVKKEVLEKTGGFDELFFMYGEDIDLSYRIREAGYTNYYLGKNTIIHFKGESTKKDIRYTKLFYTAMNIFVQKHYAKKSYGFALLMQVAIAIRGVLSFIGQLFLQRKPPGITSKMVNTILAGEPSETKRAAEILLGQQIKRKITCLTDLSGIYKAIESERADEIVFCAGTLGYNDIIDCMGELKGNNIDIEYKFFAARSNGIVGSVSKKSSGEIMVSGKLNGG